MRLNLVHDVFEFGLAPRGQLTVDTAVRAHVCHTHVCVHAVYLETHGKLVSFLAYQLFNSSNKMYSNKSAISIIN